LKALKRLKVEVQRDVQRKIADVNQVLEEYKAAEAKLVALDAARVQKEFFGLLVSVRLDS
jgi:hypothetical protein